MPTLITYPYSVETGLSEAPPMIGSLGTPPSFLWDAVNAEDETHWLDFEPVTDNGRTVFRFDMSELPEGAIPTGVQLEFQIERAGGSTSALSVRTAAIDGNGALVYGVDERPIRGSSGRVRLLKRETLGMGESWGNYGNVCAVVKNFRGSDPTGALGHQFRLLWVRAIVEYADGPPEPVALTLSGTIAVPTACGWTYIQENGAPQTHFRVAISPGSGAVADPETFTGWLFDTGKTQGAEVRSISLAGNPLPDGTYRQYTKVWGRLSDGTVVSSAWVSSEFTVAGAPVRPNGPVSVTGGGWDGLRGGAAVTVDPLGAGSRIQLQRSADGGDSWADVDASQRGYDYEALIDKHAPTHLFDAMDLSSEAAAAITNRGSAGGSLYFDESAPGVRIVSDGRKRLVWPGNDEDNEVTFAVSIPETTYAAIYVEAVIRSFAETVNQRIGSSGIWLNLSASNITVYWLTPIGYRYAVVSSAGAIELGVPFELRAIIDTDADTVTVKVRRGGSENLFTGWAEAPFTVTDSSSTAVGGSVAPGPIRALGAATYFLTGNGVGNYYLDGSIWRFALYDLEADELMTLIDLDADVSDSELISGPETFTATSGETVTIAQATTGIPVEVVGRSVWQRDQVDDASATFNFDPDGGESMTIIQIARMPVSASSYYPQLLGNRASHGTAVASKGLMLRANTTGSGTWGCSAVLDDGVTIVHSLAPQASGVPYGEMGAAILRLDAEGQILHGATWCGTNGLAVGPAQSVSGLGEWSNGPFVVGGPSTHPTGSSPIPAIVIPRALSDSEISELCSGLVASRSAGIVRDLHAPLEERLLYRARAVNVDGDAVSDWVQASAFSIELEDLIRLDRSAGVDNGWWILADGDQTLSFQPEVEEYGELERRRSVVALAPAGGSVSHSPSLGDVVELGLYARDREQRLKIQNLLRSGRTFRLIDLHGRSRWLRVSSGIRKNLWRVRPRAGETAGLADFNVITFTAEEVREPV